MVRKYRGEGVVRVIVHDEQGKDVKIELSNVLYVPKMKMNLLSIRCVNQKGHITSFSNGGGSIEVIGPGTRKQLFFSA